MGEGRATDVEGRGAGLGSGVGSGGTEDCSSGGEHADDTHGGAPTGGVRASKEGPRQDWGGLGPNLGGGRNADVEHGRKEIKGLGERGLPTQTTLGGRVFGSWLQQVRMWQVDSHKPINKRGTWRHNRTKQWYELDHFTASAGVKRACLQIRTFQGVADHRGKQMVMQLGREGKRKRRTERKQKFLAIEAKRKEGRVGRLNMEDFREN